MRLGRERPRKREHTKQDSCRNKASMRLGRERPRKSATPGQHHAGSYGFNEAGARTPQKFHGKQEPDMKLIAASMRLGRERPRNVAAILRARTRPPASMRLGRERPRNPYLGLLSGG